jgi:hypothetical protein
MAVTHGYVIQACESWVDGAKRHRERTGGNLDEVFNDIIEKWLDATDALYQPWRIRDIGVSLYNVWTKTERGHPRLAARV